MRKYIYNILFTILLISGFNLTFATRYEKVERTGVVTYKSSQNVYVKFENTSGINQGDTLFIGMNNKMVPALKVQFISTKSCAGETINGMDLNVDDRI